MIFFALCKSKNSANSPTPRTPKSRTSAKESSFLKHSIKIGRLILETQKKLENFEKLASKNTLFDDPSEESDALTIVIKQDLTILKKETEELQKLRHTKWNKQTQSHSDVILFSLNSHLADITKNFSDALQKRSETTKEQFKRADDLTGFAGTTTELRQRKRLDTGVSPTDGKIGTVFIPMEGVSQSLLSAERNVGAVEKIESTIGEIGRMFQQLAGLVAEQGDLLDRIDANVNNSLDHTSRAQNWLLKYRHAITSDRGLIIKLFVVVIIVTTIFIVFYS